MLSGGRTHTAKARMHQASTHCPASTPSSSRHTPAPHFPPSTIYCDVAAPWVQLAKPLRCSSQKINTPRNRRESTAEQPLSQPVHNECQQLHTAGLPQRWQGCFIFASSPACLQLCLLLCGCTLCSASACGGPCQCALHGQPLLAVIVIPKLKHSNDTVGCVMLHTGCSCPQPASAVTTTATIMMSSPAAGSAATLASCGFQAAALVHCLQRTPAAHHRPPLKHNKTATERMCVSKKSPYSTLQHAVTKPQVRESAKHATGLASLAARDCLLAPVLSSSS